MGKLTKKQIDVKGKAVFVMNEHEISEDGGYEIFGTQEVIKLSDKTAFYFNIHFKKEGNTKVIKALEELGWIKDKVYKNHNGSPAFFCSDLFDDKGELEKTIPMVRMKYLFD